MSSDRPIAKEEESLFERATGTTFTRREFLKWSSALASAAIADGLLWDDHLGLFRVASAQEKMAGKVHWSSLRTIHKSLP